MNVDFQGGGGGVGEENGEIPGVHGKINFGNRGGNFWKQIVIVNVQYSNW